MSAVELIAKVKSAGIRLFLEGGRLAYEGNAAAVEMMLPEVKAHKDEILALLKAQTCEAAVTGELTPSLSRAVAMTQEVFSRPPKPQPNDGLSPDAREALGVIRKIANSQRFPDPLAVADSMQVSVTAISGALVELERKGLIHPGDWTRCGTKIKLVTH